MDLPAVCVGCAGAMLLALVGGGCQKPAVPAPTVTLGGMAWKVELALTVEQRYHGLSDRPKLDADKGMLFIFPQPDIHNFCMRQCLIPLDIAFLDSDRRVVKTYTMAVEPYGLDRKAYSSESPAQYALEVPAGALAKAGVKVGDQAEFSAVVPLAAKAEPDP
jgi:uncharacterized membrane protein (UPF0127 family)